MGQGIIELPTNRECLAFQMVEPKRNYALNRHVPILLIRANVGVPPKVSNRTVRRVGIPVKVPCWQIGVHHIRAIVGSPAVAERVHSRDDRVWPAGFEGSESRPLPVAGYAAQYPEAH